jgi:phage major head subunit gpT-like protein
MELTQGNLGTLYTGWKGALLNAVEEAPIPEDVRAFVMEDTSTNASEKYATMATLGDLEELIDEYPELNLGEFMQEVPNRHFGAKLKIPTLKILNDEIDNVGGAMRGFGTKAAQHPYKRVPTFFTDGFTTAWGPDGANVWSNDHVWPGGVTWDNLDYQPLTHAGYRLVRQHLVERSNMDGEPMELRPTHIVVGESNRINAQEVLKGRTLANGATNPDYDEDITIVVWSKLSGDHAWDWFLGDLRNERPITVQNREGPTVLMKGRNPQEEPRWSEEAIELKPHRLYGEAITCPWVIQAVQGGSSEPTTTTQAG